MRSYLLRCELKTRRSLAEAFAVFEDPRNLARITPPWLNFRITTAEEIVMRRGARIDYRIRWLGLPVAWSTLITDYEPPHRFIDFQDRGPYVLWRHLHSFTEDTDGTVVADEVRYVLPFGPLGWLAHSWKIGDQLIEIFQYRQRAIGDLLGEVTQVRPPLIVRAQPVTGDDIRRYRRMD
ncbi:MAG: SRPBCC family protein [Bryobacteraceae bacterium]